MNVIQPGQGIAGCVPGPMAQGDCAITQGEVEMRELTLSELEAVDGGINVGVLLAAIGAAALIYDFTKGFVDGYQQAT
ncbi:hypothetical protein [Vulcaniibacterium gelatinicum]|uniref:hypothetical protein n=1 Tax=Vulcaniibacterium gelatinicum TaxID=2598725 RepID=UPI0011C91F06|nr:hypothetical protein [Vulcaniibacterium gelatinicum]